MRPDSTLTYAEVEARELREVADRLAQALDRTERNLLLSIRGRPVRDLCETLAENQAARDLGGYESP